MARRPSKPRPQRTPRPAAPKPAKSVYITGIDDEDGDDEDTGECDEHPEFLSRRPREEKRGKEPQ